MGTVDFGSSKDTTFTIRNVGGCTLADSIKFLDNSPPFSALTRHYALRPGDSIAARIRFSGPTGTPGHGYTYVGNLFFVSQCAAQGLEIQVTATAREARRPPACAISPTPLDFGTAPVGQNKDLTFDVRNSATGRRAAR